MCHQPVQKTDNKLNLRLTMTGAVEVQVNRLAKFGLWVSLIALLGVIVQLPWYASLILALLAAVTGCIAKYQIDRSNGALKGNLIAFLAIIIACIVIAIAWSQRQPSLPESSDLQSAFLPHQADTHYNTQLGSQNMAACVIVFR